MGMITGDGGDSPKSGSNSVGVSRQCSGRLGKNENCQAGVFVGYAGPRGFGLVDCELFMPDKWFGDDFKEKREKCRVPEGLEFMTKNVILSRTINRVWSSGIFKGRYVGVDAAFGHDHDFLDSLPEAAVYFADVHGGDKVFPGRPEMITPPCRGRGRRPAKEAPSFPARTVKDVVADESAPWNEVMAGNGSNGPILRRDKCVRVVENRDNMPGKDVWLYARELRETHLGMADCQLRTWHGWMRRMMLTLISHLLVIMLRNRLVVTPDRPEPVPFVASPVKAIECALGRYSFRKQPGD